MLNLHADRAPVVEENPANEAVGHDREVATIAGGIEVSDAGTPANPFCIV